MKQKINSDQFAARMGAYSHGYKVDLGSQYMIFTTGQIALDADGNVVYENNTAKQAEFVFESLQKILKEAGSSLDDTVKATIYLTDIKDFAQVSPVRNKFFANSEPVSTLVEVSSLVKLGCKIEIEVIAITNK
jgi:2-iminobutanoate/2-iminopropanoate deaminase